MSARNHSIIYFHLLTFKFTAVYYIKINKLKLFLLKNNNTYIINDIG
jgi:hypothetical protein